MMAPVSSSNPREELAQPLGENRPRSDEAGYGELPEVHGWPVKPVRSAGAGCVFSSLFFDRHGSYVRGGLVMPAVPRVSCGSLLEEGMGL